MLSGERGASDNYSWGQTKTINQLSDELKKCRSTRGKYIAKCKKLDAELDTARNSNILALVEENKKLREELERVKAIRRRGERGTKI